ncbi:MAG TPA: anti-sigma factor antagonist [Planctomycetota bacterium]
MPDLTIQVQEVKGLSGTALVVLAGSIDAKTVITFQTHLNSVKERGIERFIMDMESVKYVNSTGLGYLINLADSVTEKGGISLVKVQPKVKVVFDMLGLNAFFKIFATREEALKHLNEGAHPSSPNDQTVVLQTRPTPPSPGTQRSVVPAPPPAPVRNDPPPPITARHVVAQPTAATPAGGGETLHVECQACRALLAVKDVGTYKCPRCLTPFSYAGGGKVSFLPRQKALPVQLSLNFSAECTDGLLEFVSRMSRKSGFSSSGISEVQSAVKDTVDVIKRHSYGGNENNVYHVLMVSVDSELEIRFADYGTALNGGGEMFASLKRTMDRFELRNHPRGGNVVTVSKKAK